MNFREMNLAVFERRPIPHVFFQPRFEPWVWWHHKFHCMPPRYQGLTLPQFYDYVDGSMRTVHYYTGCPDPIVRRFDPAVKVHRRTEANRTIVAYDTPHGQLVEEHEMTIDQVPREVRFPVRTSDDLRCLTWLFGHVRWSFSPENFARGEALIGPRGEPSFWVPKSPYQALAQQWMKLEDLIFALADDPQVVQDALRAIDDSYDPLYEQLTAAGCLKILNFGENIHEQLISPAYFEKYFLPFYEKRVGQLRRAGIFTHVHVDGHFHTMLPWLKHFPHDGIEALTAAPQGDMTLEEIRDHLGDKILLDGIPAVLFLPDLYSREQLMECVEKLVKYFHPRLVLGVSDEVPEGTGEEAIERVKMIGAWCRQRR